MVLPYLSADVAVDRYPADRIPLPLALASAAISAAVRVAFQPLALEARGLHPERWNIALR